MSVRSDAYDTYDAPYAVEIYHSTCKESHTPFL
uniref:Uncharacterized protein n=1 Tax=Arundo donax TaxID=35708 RepID=A0A0A9B0L8_ARUDO